MPRLSFRRVLRPLFLAGLLTALSPIAAQARTPVPYFQIPLEPLGLLHLPPQLVVAGSSLLTVDYVDEHHLLVTFAVRRLMTRIPNEDADDFDRTVEAILLDLPSGKPLARTSWRLHDTNRYLWNVGHGHFLLRIHDRITSFSPLANLASGHPFQEFPLLNSQRRVAVVLLSPEGDLLTLETLAHRKPAAASASTISSVVPPHRSTGLIPRTGPPPANPDSEAVTSPAVYQINFFRLLTSEDPNRPVIAQAAGVIGSLHAVAIPADTAGFLSILDESRGHWAFNFNAYAGKTQELSPFDSNCQPFPEFVSRSEFVAFGCRNGQDPQVLAGFNLRGEEMWEQVLSGAYVSTALTYSPAADRFSLSRVLTTGTLPAIGEPVEGQILSQVLTVYQTDSGRQIFNLNITPISRTGENATLSPDGMELAVIRESILEVYRLPELTGSERASIKKAESLRPLPGTGPILIDLPLVVSSVDMAKLVAARDDRQKTGLTSRTKTLSSPITSQPAAVPLPADPPTPSSAPPTAEAASTPAPSSNNSPSGDVPHRKPPTLYTLPGPQAPQ